MSLVDLELLIRWLLVIHPLSVFIKSVSVCDTFQQLHNLEIDHREAPCMHGFDGEEVYGCGEEEVQCCGVGAVVLGQDRLCMGGCRQL